MKKDLDHGLAVARAVASGAAVRSRLMASWQRCISHHGLDPFAMPEREPLSGHGLDEVLEQRRTIIGCSTAIIERLQASIADNLCCTLLADPDGVAVYCDIRKNDRAYLQTRSLCVGADWSETRAGTNGIGTCLAEKRLTVVRTNEHFYCDGHDMTCAVAPVFGPDGDIAAALNLSCYAADGDLLGGFMAIAAVDAARRIEARLFREHFDETRIVSVEGTADSIGLLAVDDDDVVIGATFGARQALSVTAATLAAGIAAPDLLGENDDPMRAERGTVRRALLRSRGNVTAAAGSLSVSRATMKRKINHFGLGRDSSR